MTRYSRRVHDAQTCCVIVHKRYLLVVYKIHPLIMSSAALKFRAFTRPIVRSTPIFRNNTIRMSSTNEYGQGKSHAQGDSAVPGKVQEAAPSGLEEALPDSVRQVYHDTHSNEF
jgi:hypothetical protein